MMTEDDLKKRIMNEGFPLQRYCSSILQSGSWNVDEEYPVQWIPPPQSDPYKTSKIVRTSGDLRAEYQYVAKGFAIQMCISCKRQLSIDWVFMRAMFRESEHFFPRLCAIKSDSGDYKNAWEYEYSFENKDWPEPYSLCNIPTTLTDKSGKAPEVDKILQTADNLHSEVAQTISDDSLPLVKIMPIQQIIYVPVIVTAAEIFVYDVDSKKFDVKEPNCIKVENVPYLLYQHRLPLSKHH